MESLFNRLCSFISKCHNRFASGQDYLPAQKEICVKVKHAGKLLKTLGIQRVESVEKLTVHGELNGTDIACIRKMKRLEQLNLKEARIVPGGICYQKYCHTSKNHIGKYAFEQLTNLKEIVLPDTITCIEERAFAECRNLTAVELPETLTHIEAEAFINTKLKEISIPQSVIFMGKDAIAYCPDLTSVTLKDGNKPMQWVGDAFTSCPVETFYLGRDLGFYDYCEFHDPSTLRSVTIGHIVKTVNIHFGSHIKEITCLNAQPPQIENGFNQNCTVYVPKAYYEAYWIHPFWGKMDIKPI